jgi:hypothetical protein
MIPSVQRPASASSISLIEKAPTTTEAFCHPHPTGILRAFLSARFGSFTVSTPF